MANEKIWFETAKDHLRAAKKNLKIGEHLIAFNEAIYCAEVALKAVLEKYGKFFNQDKHHKIPTLFEKIKSERCLPPNLTLHLENLIGDERNGGLGYIDMCLLASAMLTNVPIWTLDKKLNMAASWLSLDYTER